MRSPSAGQSTGLPLCSAMMRAWSGSLSANSVQVLWANTRAFQLAMARGSKATCAGRISNHCMAHAVTAQPGLRFGPALLAPPGGDERDEESPGKV